MSKLRFSIFAFLILLGGVSLLFGCKNNTEYAAFPFIKISDSIFIIDTDGYVVTELSADYEVIGEVKNKTNSINCGNGDSSCCDIGDKIYQSVSSKNEIYVYTKLFSGNNEYRYLRFNKK